MIDRLLPLADVCAQSGLSRTRVYELMAKREFPDKVAIGGSSRWSEREVGLWIELQKSRRYGPSPKAVAS